MALLSRFFFADSSAKAHDPAIAMTKDRKDVLLWAALIAGFLGVVIATFVM
jgi:hypothetical protein